jgi:hypothetical protein
MPSYGTRFVEPLRHDFPRIPLPSDGELFASLASKGGELERVQLMEAEVPTAVNFPVPGTNVVASGHPKYLRAGSPDPLDDGVLNAGRVYISADAPGKEVCGQGGRPRRRWAGSFGVRFFGVSGDFVFAELRGRLRFGGGGDVRPERSRSCVGVERIASAPAGNRP